MKELLMWSSENNDCCGGFLIDPARRDPEVICLGHIKDHGWWYWCFDADREDLESEHPEEIFTGSKYTNRGGSVSYFDTLDALFEDNDFGFSRRKLWGIENYLLSELPL